MTYTSETELHCSRTLLLFSDVLQIAGDTCPMPCTPAKRCHDGMLGMGDVSALMMACLDWVTFQVRQSGQHGSILSKNVVGDVLHLRDSRSLLNALSDVL